MPAKKSSRSSRSKSTTKSKSSGPSKRTKSTARRATAAPPKASRAGKAAHRSSGRRTGDFGIPADAPRKRQAIEVASEEIKNRPAGDHLHDPRQPRSGVDSREAGVGMREAGPGSDSGGDLDADVTGVGDGVGLAQSAPDTAANIGAAETTGGSEEFAGGPPARGEGRAARDTTGDFVDHSGEDEDTTRPGR